MKVRVLSKTDKTIFDADVMVIADFNDVAALGAATTGTLAALPGTTNGLMPAAGTSGTDTLPAGAKVALVGFVLDTQFFSATSGGLTFTVGDGNNASRYLAATQLETGHTPVTYGTGVVANQPFVYTAADTVDVAFTSVTANLSTFTAGQLRLFFKFEDLNALPAS